MNVLKRQHKKRCAGKHFYRRADSADRAAERASKRTGELIISYKCYDCTGWHIGHADATQIAARQPVGPLCAVCDQPIPEARLAKAARCKTRTATCCTSCANHFRNLRKAAREAGSKGSAQPPP